MSDRVWRLMELVNTSTDYLAGKEIESPRRNAEALLGKVLNLPRIQLYMQHDRPLAETEIAAYRELIRRRAKHEPLQLLLGQVEFHGVQLEVVPGLLIPRPETELLVEKVLLAVQSSPQRGPIRILDLGSGTGAIAVSLASALKFASVDAVDIDFEAVRCTERNAAANNVGDRVHGILADFFGESFVGHLTLPYHVVVSNPPYVCEEDYQTLAPEVRDHEPKRALVAAENGLACCRRICELLPEILEPGGIFAFEIGIGQDTAVRDLVQPLDEQVRIERDLANIPRMVIGINRQERSSNRTSL